MVIDQWAHLGKDDPNVMQAGAWDSGYALAAEYFPGLPREDFYANAADYSLAMAEWEEIVGAGEPEQRPVERFYARGYGLLFHLLRDVAPGQWGALEDRANIVRSHLSRFRLGTVLDFGGGIGGTAQQLARWGYAVGMLEVGEVLRFARWYAAREGLWASGGPCPDKVCYFKSFHVAARRHWQAIVALDVLEHCWEPAELLRAFAEALPPGGLLIATRHSFKEHPTHLARTFWLFDQLDDVLAELGLRRDAPPDPHYGIAAWQKQAVEAPVG